MAAQKSNNIPYKIRQYNLKDKTQILVHRNATMILVATAVTLKLGNPVKIIILPKKILSDVNDN